MRNVWPGPVSAASSSGFTTQPVPSIAGWLAGSASTANTSSAGAGIVAVTLMVSLGIAWSRWASLISFREGRPRGEAKLIGRPAPQREPGQAARRDDRPVADQAVEQHGGERARRAAAERHQRGGQPALDDGEAA